MEWWGGGGGGGGVHEWESNCVQFFKPSPGERLGEILSIKERLDLDPGLMLRAESSLSLLHLSPQLLDGSVVSLNVFARLLLVELDEVVHNSLVEILSPLVATTSNTPLSMVRRDTSKVPPPRLSTRMFFSPSFLSKP